MRAVRQTNLTQGETEMQTTQATRKIWVGTDPEPNDRLILEVSEVDYQRIAAAKGTDMVISFADSLTHYPYHVRYADCGANCRCALELVEE
jgi:hypothetical protein